MRPAARLAACSAASVLLACSENPVVEQKGDPELTLNRDSVSVSMGASPGQQRVTPDPCNSRDIFWRLI
jgi:hypothetical protein